MNLDLLLHELNSLITMREHYPQKEVTEWLNERIMCLEVIIKADVNKLTEKYLYRDVRTMDEVYEKIIKTSDEITRFTELLQVLRYMEGFNTLPLGELYPKYGDRRYPEDVEL